MKSLNSNDRLWTRIPDDKIQDGKNHCCWFIGFCWFWG